jgi:hypothetical protein
LLDGILGWAVLIGFARCLMDILIVYLDSLYYLCALDK